MLEIKDLHVTVDGTQILKGITLTILPGEIHAIMGPNGAGKSTLARVLAGDAAYEITQGTIHFDGEEVASLPPEVRAHKGIFMGFQYPIEIAGITNAQFLQAAFNAKRKAAGLTPFSDEQFEHHLQEKLKEMGMRPEFMSRNLNEGFSGGEKKRNEILQMALLEPKLAVLDETDSGLDIDAMKAVAEGVNHLMGPHNALLLITHYQRLLDYIKPHFIHVVIDGKIVKTGDGLLAKQLEAQGYGSF